MNFLILIVPMISTWTSWIPINVSCSEKFNGFSIRGKSGSMRLNCKVKHCGSNSNAIALIYLEWLRQRLRKPDIMELVFLANNPFAYVHACVLRDYYLAHCEPVPAKLDYKAKPTNNPFSLEWIKNCPFLIRNDPKEELFTSIHLGADVNM